MKWSFHIAGRTYTVLSMMNKFVKKADNLAHGVREHGKYFIAFRNPWLFSSTNNFCLVCIKMKERRADFKLM
jgi:hypothetical protein